MPTLHDVYQKLPYPFKVIMASARGYYLKAWRYGKDHERRVEAIMKRDDWVKDDWAQWQKERLAFVLGRAATQVPYYRDYWTKKRWLGEDEPWKRLDNWPILEKEALRQFPQAFLVDGSSPRWMFHEHTSGTTGKSLDLWWSPETVRHWFALLEVRGRRWYGVSKKDRWAILGGQLVTPVSRRKPPFWVWNQALNQLYLSSYHLAPDLIPWYLDALVRYQVHYLWGYTSALYALAQGAISLGRNDINMKVVITNAEPLEEYQRTRIEAAFNCPVRETYGMAEIAAAASECEAGHLHLWPEVGVVEIVDGESKLQKGQTGDLVCTGLLNVDMPLIRYRVGDRGKLSESDQICVCGRGLPIISSVEGRSDDILYTFDGRKIGRLDPVFKSYLPVREAQIIQERLDMVRVRYIPLPGFKQEDGHSIISRIQARMGDISVVLEPVSEISREPNGKFRAVINQIPAEELGSLIE